MNAHSIRNIIGVLSIAIATGVVLAGFVAPFDVDATGSSCQITANKTSVQSGGSVTFTLTANGAAGKTVRLFDPSMDHIKSWSDIGGSFNQTHTMNITESGSYRIRLVDLTDASNPVKLCEKTVDITVTTAGGEDRYIDPPACPFTAQANRTIVRFGDARLLSTHENRSQTAPVNVALPAGTYTVRMASFDGYVGRTQTDPVDQAHEQWKAVVKAGTSVIGQSGYIQDLPDRVEQATVQGVASQNLVLAQAGTSVFAKHAFYPDTHPNSVMPLCVAFDKQPTETPAPTCTMTANKTTITRGESVTLSWTSNNASSATLNNGHGTIPVDGSKVVSPTESKTFTATFTGTNNRTVNCSVAITVHEAPVTPTCPLTAADGMVVNLANTFIRSDQTEAAAKKGPYTVSIPAGHYKVTLASFDNHGAAHATQANESWFLKLNRSGVAMGSINTGTIGDLPDDQNYKKQVVNQDLNIDANINQVVAMHAAYPNTQSPNSIYPLCAAFKRIDVTPPAPSCTLTADDTTLTRGESTEIRWTSTNANSAVLNQGIGSVNLNGHRGVSPIGTATFTLTVANSAGVTRDCSVTITVDTPTPAPSCTLTASKTVVIPGESVTLNWTSENTTGGSMNQGIGAIDANGNRSVTVNDTTTYTATFTGTNGQTVTCEKTVSVDDLPPPPPPPGEVACTLTADDTTLTRGEVTTIRWTSQNAVSAVLNQGIGSVNVNGNRQVSPIGTATFTLTVTGAMGQTHNCSVTITVDEPEPEAPSCTLTADDTTLTRGESTEIRWTSTNANSAVLNQGIGSVNLNGHRGVSPIGTATFTLTVTGENNQTAECSTTIYVDEVETHNPTCTLTLSDTSIRRGESIKVRWSSEHAVSAVITPINETRLNGEDDESPTETTTYVGTFTGDNGQTVTCQDTVVIESFGTPWCEVFVNPNSITEGQSATLTWNSRNVDSVSFDNGIGSVGTQGIQTVSPSDDTTYVGTFVGQNGNTITCDTTLVVNPDTGTPGPMCTMTVDTTEPVERGSTVLLSWTSDNATQASIDNNLGTVDLDGSRNVTVTNPTTFTGTFTADDGRSVNCQASVRIKTGGGGGPCLNCGDDDDDDDDDDDEPTPSIVLSKHFEAGKPRFITLTDVPYTGFEAGPVLTAFFWLTIVALSAGIAYTVTYKQPFARVTRAFSVNAMIAHEEEIENRSKAVTPVRASTASVAMPTIPHVFAEAPVYGNGGPDAAIEDAAHAEHILLSPEALMVVSQEIDRSNAPVHGYLAQFFAEVKQHFAPEDGWILLSRERATAIAIALKSAPKAAAPVVAAPAPEFVAPAAKVEAPAAQATAAVPAMPAAAKKAAAPATDVATFVSLLTGNKQEEVFATLRDLNAKEGSASAFIGEVVRELDEVYKHRIEGNHNVNPSIAASVAILSNADLEKVIGILVESVDYSYSSARVGSKIAVAKVFEFFANKKA